MRRRNGDADLRVLERRYQADPSDLSVYIAILAARRRAGISVNQGVPPADVEAYALLLEAMIETAMTTRPRVVMAAQLGHAAARLAAPEWAALGDNIFDDHTSRCRAIRALGNHRELVSFACDCAERNLPAYELARPGDMRPRRAIEAARAWVAAPSNRTADAASNAADAIFNLSASTFGGYYAFAYAAGYSAEAASSTVIIAETHVAAVTYECEIVDDGSRLWQERRLSQYLLGEVALPPINTTT